MIRLAAHRRMLVQQLCLLLLICNAGWLYSQDESTPTFVVRGAVVNGVTHQPIARALVVLPGESTGAILTDSEGKFEFPNVSGGQHMLLAKRPGFFSSTFQQEATQSIIVGPRMEDVVLLLQPAASISGHIDLSTSDPPERVRVQLVRHIVQDGRVNWQVTEMRSVNSDGRFRFGNLQPGEYRVCTTSSLDDDDAPPDQTSMRWGFPPVCYPEADASSTTGILKLPAGQDANAELELNRQSFFSVTVSITNTTSDGIGFQIRDRNGRLVEAPAIYNPQKHGVQAYLPNGDYTFIGQSYGTAYGFGSTPLHVRGAPVSGVGVTILPLHPIPVNIRKDFTAPDTANPQQISSPMVGSGAAVEISPDVNLMLTSTTSGEIVGANLQRTHGSSGDSGWALPNVLPGTYWVQSYANQAYIASITAGGTDLSHEPLVIGPGGASAPIDIVLRNDTATLSVRLKKAATADDRVPAAFLYLIPQFDPASAIPQGMPLTRATQDHLPNLQPGSYRAIALDRPVELEYHNPKAMEAYADKGQAITLEPGGNAQIDLDILPSEVTQP